MTNNNHQKQYLWWQDGIIYQVYPRSFQDSDGDGNGDLRGVIRRLDYLKDLGVRAVWLSPIYPSPMADFDIRGVHFSHNECILETHYKLHTRRDHDKEK